MFDNVGKNLDAEANKRTAASLLLSAFLIGGTAGTVSLVGAFMVAEEIIDQVFEDDEEMVEVDLEDEEPEELEAPEAPEPEPEPEPEEQAGAQAAEAPPEVTEEDPEPDPPEDPDNAKLDPEPDKDLESRKRPPGNPDANQNTDVDTAGSGNMSLGGGGGNDVAKGPKVIHHTEVQWARQSPLPRYPSAAKSMNLGDQNCKVRLFLDAKGFVTDLEFVQCNPVFHEACRTAMTRWKAFPVRAAGRKVATQFVMNVKFKLR